MNDNTLNDQAQKTWEMLQHFISQSEKRDKAYEKRIFEINQELSSRFKETDQRFKETDQKFKETSQLIKESSNKADKYLGKIHEFDRNWGKLVESLVAPSIVKQFQKEKFEIEGMSQRMMRRKAGKT